MKKLRSDPKIFSAIKPQLTNEHAAGMPSYIDADVASARMLYSR